MAASASGLALAHLLQATPPLTPRAATWGRALAWSAAGALLALPGVWRPPYLLLLAAGGGLALEPRSGRASRLAALAGGAAVVVAISVGGQELISGSWSPYGGERRGFSELEGFPGVDFPASEWSRRVESKGNTSWLGERTFEASLAPALLGWNLLYLIAGRTVGLAPYFLPAFAALLRRRGDRGTRLEQAIGLLVPLAFVALNPWNFYGGAGSVANRYFLPAYPLFWFAGAGAARSVLSTLAAAPFLAALWAAPAAYPVTPDGPRYVAAAARRFLPIETTQRHVKAPGRADVVHGDLWVRFLDASVRPSAAGPDRLALQAGHPAEILVGRGAPLRALSIEAVAGAPVSLRVAGPGGVVRLQPPLDARLELDRPTARHRMWWSEAPFWLYRIELEAEAAAATTVELRLRAEAK
jgi:hypothetical protein